MLQIRYLVLVPDDNEQITPFQGFNLKVTDRDFSFLIRSIIYFPSHPLEIFMDQKSLLEFRRHARPKNVATFNVALFSSDCLDDQETIYVVACLPEHIDFVQKQTTKLSIKPIIISIVDEKDIVNVKKNQLHPCMLDREIRRRIVSYKEENNINSATQNIRERYKAKLKLPRTGGGAIISNELFLENLGFSFSGQQDLPAMHPERYIDFVVDLANLTLKKIEFENHGNEIILYSPGIVPKYYDIKQHFWNKILRNIEIKWHKEFVTDGLIKNPYYSSFAIKDPTSDNPVANPIIAGLILIRKRELLTTNLSIALLASSTFSPPIRLPNSINFHYRKLQQLEEFSRRHDRKAHQLMQKKFLEINEEVQKNIGKKIEEIIKEKSNFCTVCSDFPLEWIYFGKLPLMISHEVSKIPMTPGNMLLQYCSIGIEFDIKVAVFQEILVIRSFKDNDKLKNILERAIDGYPISGDTKINFVDVKTISEVIENLNNFNGALVVFDCHGNHEGADGPGWLAIGDEKLNTWELAHKARIPPVVLLSACLTSAIGGSHASVANGLLRSGALSVLGTFLPVNGVSSAIFMARIIYRLDAFLPAIKKMGKEMITWRTLISTFFRMSYVTDFLNYFEKKEKILSSDDFKRIHMNCNLKINALHEDWFDQMLYDLSEVTKKTPDDLVGIVQSNNPLMESMLYCHHGRPDLLTIHF